MKWFAVRAVLLSAAVGDESSSAPGAGSLIRPDHIFFPKQLCPDNPIHFRIDGQHAFQKVIAVNSPVMNRRIAGIDDSALLIFNTFSVDEITAFFVRQGSDLPDQHIVHSLDLLVFFHLFIVLCDPAVRPITQSGGVVPLCVRIMLRGGMTQSNVYLNAQDSFSCTGSRGDEALTFGFHRHHITGLPKSISRFENFGRRCGIRLPWRFCVFPISCNDGFTGVPGLKVFTK